MAAIDSYFWISPGVTLAGAAVFGLIVGSFLNVVIHRLPLMMQAQWDAEADQADQADRADLGGRAAEAVPAASPLHDGSRAGTPAPFNLMVPRSRCPHCGHGITAAENIPVLSWLWLRGRCSACGARISARYPLVEILSGMLAVASIAHFGPTLAGLGAAALCFALIALH